MNRRAFFAALCGLVCIKPRREQWRLRPVKVWAHGQWEWELIPMRTFADEGTATRAWHERFAELCKIHA
jgi:hypothetical protein